MHITGLRPLSVINFEETKNERYRRIGSNSGQFGLAMIALKNAGIIKHTHGDLYENSIWYTVYGGKGRVESAHEDSDLGDVSRLYVKFCGENQGQSQCRYY